MEGSYVSDARRSARKGDGEANFFNYIKHRCKVIFDVGCFAGTYEDGRVADNSFIKLKDVSIHYFDPVPEFVDELQALVTNTDSYFNKFGLTDVPGTFPYYTEVMSFLDRHKTLPHRVTEPDKYLKLQRADEYVVKHNINSIDFLKIDVEGYENNVIKGFGDHIKNVNIIQFEYGGCWIDNEVQLSDVVAYLEEYGFTGFSYIYREGIIPMQSPIVDDFEFSNIVCYNTNFADSWQDIK